MSQTQIADLLAADDGLEATELRPFHGFKGLHGGLAAALMVRRMRAGVPPDQELLSLGARFVKPVGGPVAVKADTVRSGSATTLVAAALSADGVPNVLAEALFGKRTPRGLQTFAPRMPSELTALEQAQPFLIPPEFVPIAQKMQIRPATPELPYSGSRRPELCAWVRLTDEVPDPAERLVILADALAPSYTAILTTLTIVPTVELSIRISDQAAATEFDWVLIRARTEAADEAGWVDETIDLWSESGVHLASARQLRLVR
ncbi:thioesterase family protein [Nocardia sp. NPDC050712]|uniref:acyl-CoA thioesterase n=1 Tax=Nocardia sp. NPDC050712 TaxID=3155518 RepID=UPI0033F76003